MSLDEPKGHIGFTLNGDEITIPSSATARLSEVLREVAGAKDVKVGCNAGDCGACTVLVDGAPVCACLTAVGQVSGRAVDTQSGLVARDVVAQRLARSFQRHQAAQCGICTPGMMVSAVALLRSGGTLDEARVADALGGVLCRCTGYRERAFNLRPPPPAQNIARAATLTSEFAAQLTQSPIAALNPQ